MDYIGIDYGGGVTNIDKANGIRFGVISQNSVGPAWWDLAEPEYGKPTCPDCGKELPGERGDFFCEDCDKEWNGDDVFPDEALGYTFDKNGYSLFGDGDGDVWVTKSPYYTHAQFCSPCAPGAGHLDHPMESGPKTYCLGHDWFEDGKAPYPVFSVTNDAPVEAEVSNA